jgi:streptogramin lyase
MDLVGSGGRAAGLGLLLVFGVACNKASHETPRPAPSVSPSALASAAVARYAEGGAKSYPLPSSRGPVNLELITYDGAAGRVWIPLLDTGSVGVFTIATSTFTEVSGFKTTEVGGRRGLHMEGPHAAAVGDGVVYIGNRAAGEVCVVDEATLQRGWCLHIPSAPDVLTYVAASKELWVTTPWEDSIVVLDASKPDKLETKLVIKAGGLPEECALDPLHGRFYTKLATKSRVFAFDVKTHALLTSWPFGCNDMVAGSAGIAVDSARDFVFVACINNGLEVHDGAHDGALLGKLDTGAGVYGIDYVAATKRLYVTGRASRLSTVEISDGGVPAVAETTHIPEGARNAVADSKGAIFIVDQQTARLLVFAPK